MIPEEDAERYSEIERQLARLYRSVSPQPGFAQRLEHRLEGQARRMGMNPKRRFHLWSETLRGAAKWVWAAAGIALLAAVIVFAMSLLPQPPSALIRVIATQQTTQAPTSTQTAAPTFTQPVEMGGTQPTPTPTPYPVYVLAKQNTVKLYAAPGTDYAVVGTLSPGEKLLMNGKVTEKGWVPVAYPPGSGKTAWVWIETVITLDAGDAQNGVPAPADWVRASNPRLDEGKLLIDVCFNLLDNGDWMIREAILRANQGNEPVEIGYDAATLISLRPFTTDSEGVHHGERCDVLEFPVGADFALENATLVVGSLEAFPREGQDCELYLTSVQPLLTARDTGILISCESQPHSGGLINVIAKPQGMPLDQAQALVHQAFLDSITLKGPWKFELGSLIPEDSSLPSLESQQSILAALRELNRRRSLTYFQGPGWLHMLTREMYKESGGTLPDGTPLPAEYRMDFWYELDAQGKGLRWVVRQLDMAGKELQIAITQYGLTRNLTFQETRVQEVFYLQPLDFGFSDLALSATKTNKKMTQQPLYFEGQYVGEQFIIEDDEVRWESVFDPQTGRQISFSTWEVIPEGLRFVSSVVIEAFENLPSPPAEILAYFERK